MKAEIDANKRNKTKESTFMDDNFENGITNEKESQSSLFQEVYLFFFIYLF